MDTTQILIDGLTKQWRKEREASQMTLGAFLERLRQLPDDFQVQGFRHPHSYRGYYEDLAIEPTEGTISAKDAIALCQPAMGEVFIGYKGGEYVMGAKTPMWLADYGSTGLKILAINDDGTFQTAEDE